MKSLAIIAIVFGLVGCASSRQQAKPMDYDTLSRIRVSNYQCKNIDSVVAEMERNLQLKGLLDANPEDLSDEDRKYNAHARIVIWSMRVGCNNPDRYKK